MVAKLIGSSSWSQVSNAADFTTGTSSSALAVDLTLDPTLVAPAEAVDGLTYYVRFSPIGGGGGALDGATLYQLTGFSFDDRQDLSQAASSGAAGGGKMVFDPLTLRFSQTALTPQLLALLAGGQPLSEVDVLGYDAAGHLAREASFGVTLASNLSIASGGELSVSLNFGAQELQSFATNPAGATAVTQQSAWNALKNISGFVNGSGAATPQSASLTLPAAKIAAPAASLTYYVRFTPHGGAAGLLDGQTLYQLQDFSFSGAQTVALNGSVSGLAAGKATFNALTLDLSHSALTTQILQTLTAGQALAEIDVVGYDAQGRLAAEDSFGYVAARQLNISSDQAASVSFQYAALSLRAYVPTGASSVSLSQSQSWSLLTNTNVFSTGSGGATPLSAPNLLSAATVVAPEPLDAMTYYVRFAPIGAAAGALDGATLYQLNGFSFDDRQTQTLGSSSSAITAGKASFDPLTLSFSQNALTPQLFAFLAAGKALSEVDVFGYDAQGRLASDASFGAVLASDLSLGAGGVFSASLTYGAQQLQSFGVNADGASVLTQQAAWNALKNVKGFVNGAGAATPLSASPTLPSANIVAPTDALTYYVRFTPQAGGVGPLDGATLYQLDGFSVSDHQSAEVSSSSGGAVAGAVTFNALTLQLSQAALTPALMQLLASGQAFSEIDVIGYDSLGRLAQDNSFGLVLGQTLAVASDSAASVSFAYGAESLRAYVPVSKDSVSLSQSASWDLLRNTAAFTTGSGDATPLSAPTLLAKATVAQSEPVDALTYYVRFTPIGAASGALDGATLYQLNGFSFDDQQTLALSSGAGAAAGKISFDPLVLQFSQSALTPQLFGDLVAGKALSEVDVLGYDAQGHLARKESFGSVVASDLSIASGDVFSASLNYGAQELQTYAVGASGAVTLTQQGAWNALRNIKGFVNGAGATTPQAASLTLDPTKLAAPASAGLTYYVRFTPSTAASGPFDGKTLYQLDGFSFDASQTVSIGSSGGLTAGKPTFNAATLRLSQGAPEAASLKTLAAGVSFAEIDIVGYDPSGQLAEAYQFGLDKGAQLTVDDSGVSSLSFAYASEKISSYADAPACFCAGARIATDRGETPVEALAIGDRVRTLSGALRPILWIGRREIEARAVDPLRAWPIRVRAGALGPNIPARDVLLSPDHALLIGGVLVQAGALVNGRSILRETAPPPRFSYFHIELDAHDLLLAEGAPAESFVDCVDRLAFDNWDEHLRLFPQGRALDDIGLPRVKAQRQFPRAVRALLDRALERFPALAENAAA